MPNWCENDLRIHGPVGDLKRFTIFAKSYNLQVKDLENDSILDFNSFVPYPERFRELDKIAEQWDGSRRRPKDGYNSGGYEWCRRFWGTKWNACRVSLKRYKRSLLYKFDTAWSPPTPVIFAMSECFPRLKFSIRFYEGGAGYKGHYILKDGEFLKCQTGPYCGYRGG